MNKKLLKEIVAAWESLEGNKNYSPREIADWLSEDMKPVMDKIREHLNKEKKDG
jgi:hypothetical protein